MIITILLRLDPIPEFKLRFHKTEDGKVLVILDVYKGDETPYYYSADGVLEAYVRVGNESVKATATELKRLVLRGKNTSYDSQNSTYKVEDYAFSKLKERYKKWTGNSFDDKDLISFGLVNEQGDLTNAGALLADESPIRCSRLFCTRWNGLNKSGGAVDALDDAEYSGKGIILPSVDHLYVLSRLLKIHMEDLLVPIQEEISITELHMDRISSDKRLYEYWRRLCVKKCA